MILIGTLSNETSKSRHDSDEYDEPKLSARYSNVRLLQQNVLKIFLVEIKSKN